MIDIKRHKMKERVWGQRLSRLAILGIAILLLQANSCEKPRPEILIATAPRFEKAYMTDASHLAIAFDTEVTLDELRLSPAAEHAKGANAHAAKAAVQGAVSASREQTDPRAQGAKLTPVPVRNRGAELVFAIPQPPRYEKEHLVTLIGRSNPSTSYVLRGSATDRNQNKLSFEVAVQGGNNRIPLLCFESFNPQKSKTHAPTLTLLVREGGGCGGMELEYAGYRWRKRWMLPAYELQRGDRVVLSFGEEKSRGRRARIGDDALPPDGRVYRWTVDGARGLSARGAIALRSTRGGKIIDALIYSNGTSKSYEGHGSKELLSLARELEGVWRGSPLDSSRARVSRPYQRIQPSMEAASWSQRTGQD